MVILSLFIFLEYRAMFCPLFKIGRSRERQTGDIPVPLGIGKDILSVLVLNDSRIFSAADPLVFFLVIVVRIENRLLFSLVIYAVIRYGQADPGGMPSYRIGVTVLFGPVSHFDLIVLNNGRWIER